MICFPDDINTKDCCSRSEPNGPGSIPGIAKPQPAVNSQPVPKWIRNDGLDQYRRLIVTHITEHNDIYVLSDAEKETLLWHTPTISALAQKLAEYMQSGDLSDCEAVKMVFKNDFKDIVKWFWREWIDFSCFCSSLSFEANAISFEFDNKNRNAKIFRDEQNKLYCQFENEDHIRPFHCRIRDVKVGDAFLCCDIRIAVKDAYQILDNPGAPWFACDQDGVEHYEGKNSKHTEAMMLFLMKDMAPISIASAN